MHDPITDPAAGDPKAGPLDPELARLLPRLNAAAPEVAPDTPAGQLRASFDELIALLATDPGAADPGSFDGRIVDDAVTAGGVGIPTRHWIPRVARAGEAVLFVHGGGWVLGDLASAAPTARALAERLRVRVVAVDYRLAPEHPFPAAFDDCFAVLRAERERVDAEVGAGSGESVAGAGGWLAVAGDSAGGNLAATTALAARDAGVRVDAQLLFYPGIDPRMSAPSHAAYGEGYLLSAAAMRYYWAAYEGVASGAAGESAAALDPRFTPDAAATLAGAAPAVVTTAGFDPLRDEGDAYAARLVADGVPTLVLPQPGLIHGWIDQAQQVPAARRALEQAIDALALLRAFARDGAGV